MNAEPRAWIDEIFTQRQLDSLTFTKLWQKSVVKSGLPRSAKLVALTLSLYFSGNEGDTADPSIARLADEASMHRSTVIAQLDVLAKAGMIERFRSKGRVRSRYWLNLPDVLPGLPLNDDSEALEDHTGPQPSDGTTVARNDGYESDSGSTVGLSDPTVGFSLQPSDFDPPTVVHDDPKGLKGLIEGNTQGGSSSTEPDLSDEGQQDQGPDLTTYRAHGVRIGERLRAQKINNDQARKEIQSLPADGRREAVLEGFLAVARKVAA